MVWGALKPIPHKLKKKEKSLLSLLELFTLMIQTTDIHDPLLPHLGIKTNSHPDSTLQLKDSQCNFPLKLEQSQQLVIHMHLKSNTSVSSSGPTFPDSPVNLHSSTLLRLLCTSRFLPFSVLSPPPLFLLLHVT